jgi:hypothetical protein
MTKIAKLAMLLLAIALTLSILTACKKKEEEKQSGMILDYATTGVVEMDDPEALQRAYEEAKQKAQDNTFGLKYQNDAYSTDGKTFSCRIGNSTQNADDIFIAIYADKECTDELFVSQLLRPGMAFDTVELNRTFEPGDYTFYVPHTKIRMIDGVQTIVAQVVITIDFHVTSE